MVTIQTEIQIKASADKVWSIISDLDNEPKFWKGTKSIKNLNKENNIIKREVTIAFRDQKCLQEIMLEPKKKIHVKFTKGIIVGEKILSIIPHENDTELCVFWSIKLTGIMGMFTGMIKKHIESGTQQAIQQIKKEAERQIHGV